MKNEKIYNYFYIIINLTNGHFYLGIHSTNKLADGYFGSGKALKLAIKKYGKENFELTPLKFFGTRDELMAYEREVVNERFLDYYKGICYNLKKGGEGGCEKVFTDEELKERRRKYKQSPKGKEVERKSHDKYYQQNREEILERQQEYQQSPKGKEARRKSQRKYRFKKKAEKQATQQVIII